MHSGGFLDSGNTQVPGAEWGCCGFLLVLLPGA